MRRSIQCRFRRRVGWTARGSGAAWWSLRGLVALAAMVGALLTAMPARAGSKVAFAWRTEPGATCLTEDKLRAAVEKKLGRSVFASREDAEFVIEGQEVRDRGRFRVRVTQRDRAGREHGARELTAETCAALERMTVVFIALVLEPGGAPDRAPGERTPDARAPDEGPEKARPVARKDDAAIPTARVSNSPRPRRGHVERRSPRGVDLHAGVGAGAAAGMLPSVSASVRVTTRLTFQGSRLSADWSLGMTLPQIVTEGAVRANFAAVDQQARGCWAWLDRAVRVDTCGGVFFAALIPISTNLDKQDSPALSVLGPTASLALRLAEGPATFHVELGVVTPVLRRTIHYLGRGGEERTLYATPALIGLATLSATFRVF